MANSKGTFQELENVLMDQIEKLNDDSIGGDAENIKLMIERSKAISELTKNVVEMNRFKLDVVKAAETTGGLYDEYLGITNGKAAR